MSKAKELDGYLEAAHEWEQDVERLRTDSHKKGWRCFYGSAFLNIVLAVAIAGIIPLKEFIPFLMRFNDNTGAMEMVTNLNEGISLSREKALSYHFLHNYVINRETVDNGDREARVKYVAQHSTLKLYEEYENYISNKNPDSPYNKIEDDRIEVEIDNILPLGDDDGHATVLYRTLRKNKNGRPVEKPALRAAYIQYTYFDTKEMTLKTRWKNPLGFVVTSIRKDYRSANTLSIK